MTALTGPVVLGLDPSLTATGIAVVGEAGAQTATVRSRGRKADTLVERSMRLHSIAFEVSDVVAALADRRPDLVVIEGASHGSRGGSAWDRAHLWWLLVDRWMDRDVPVAVCPPTCRIRWATGSGRATASTKSDVAVAVSRLWPDVAADGDNEWDALSLATAGAQYLGWAVPSRAHHAAARTGMAWPADLEAAA